MSLISTEVEVSLNSKNYKHYETLGYEIPRYLDKCNKLRIKQGTKILVNVNDLQFGSSVMVKVKCDDCGKEYDTHYSAFYKCNHNGKSFCLQCAKAKEKKGNREKRIEDKRKDIEYYNFLHNVLKRDHYTCQCCGYKRKELEVHHLDGYNWCKEKRTDETNGVCLCLYCHMVFHSIYGKGNNTKEQYNEWIKTIDICKLFEEHNKLKQSIEKHNQILCVTTNELFYGFRDAAGAYNIKQPDNIRLCCIGKSKSCGKGTNGEKLVWMYYQDYLQIVDI